MHELTEDCACKAIVTRAYRELMAGGYRDDDAFRSAVTVYRCRHPEASRQEAPFMVAKWICEELGQ